MPDAFTQCDLMSKLKLLYGNSQYQEYVIYPALRKRYRRLVSECRLHLASSHESCDRRGGYGSRVNNSFARNGEAGCQVNRSTTPERTSSKNVKVACQGC